MLSKDANDFLENNGYRLKVEHQRVKITHSSSDRWLIFIVGMLCTLALLLFIEAIPWVPIPMAVLFVFTLYRVSKAPSKSKLELVEGSPFMEFTQYSNVDRIYFKEIKEIKWTSVFTRSYASAHKLTSDEFTHKIVLIAQNDREIELFLFLGDYEEPDAPFSEIYEWIKGTIKKEKETAQ